MTDTPKSGRAAPGASGTRLSVPRMSVPRVSVIVPAHGVAHLLGEALASLLAQDCAEWEAIVVDDGAPDDVAAAILPFGRDPRIRLLGTDNRGVAVARNRAVRHARAPLIALLDGDDAYESDYLTTMLAAIDADPTLGFVTCDASYFGDRARAGRLFSAYVPQVPPLTLARVLSREFNIFTASVVRRAAFDAVGGYDPLLRMAEDFDLWLRLLEGGWRGGHVARPLVRYRRRPGSLSGDPRALLHANASVYRAAAGRLAGRPEAEIAENMRRACLDEALRAEGETLIIEGRTREGLDLLRRAGSRGRSLRWRMAMPLMRVLPRIAGPILRRRRGQRESDA